MKEIAERFGQKDSAVKIWCRVVKPLGNGRFQVRDAAGRLFSVPSDISCLPGAAVVVAADRIVALAHMDRVRRSYRV